ncbi:MAG TPA: RNA polymerase sigma factor [Thermoanaerobaculaceae bacterium]|nr:RNA polymerase sigma factor [Thermoanaerobaculaceae bacterium]HPS79015.1 RNA polymerase sigma factor [Thermoanaerobaculaceae bacterium]
MTQAFPAVAGSRTAARWSAAWENAEPWRALFAELAAGHREALGRLYDLASGRLYGLALWRTGCPEDAAEVVQEVFVRMAEERERLAAVRDPRWWLLSVAHRLAVDVTRRRQRRPSEPIEDHPHLEAPASDRAREVDGQRAWELVAELSPKQREVIFLHHFEGMSHAEIGRSLGVPTFTAASRYRLGLAALRRLLGSTP